MYLHNIYIKSKVLASAILYKHDASIGVQD